MQTKFIEIVAKEGEYELSQSTFYFLGVTKHNNNGAINT